MSAVVIARDDESLIERAVGAVVRQDLEESYEIIVVTSGTDATAAVARRAFPDVTVVELDRPALPGEARNAGLRLARGRYVSFPGSHVELAPGCLAGRLAAHRRGWAMVTGTMLNGTRTWAGWASYFLDNSAVLPGRPSFVFDEAPPRCSYHREALLEVGGFPEGVRTGEDTEVNEELFRRGYGAYREREAMAYHHSPCQRPGRLLIHHFQRGRARGRILAAARSQPGRVSSRGLGRFRSWSVLHRLRWTRANVRRWGGSLQYHYWRALPLIVLGAIAAGVGGSYELVLRLHPGPQPRMTAKRRAVR
ncbi:MAG: glycosyltransferase family A protein [Acidimicrobiia bacterium]